MNEELTQKQSQMEVVRISMEATCKYVFGGIKERINKYSYLRAFKKCYNICFGFKRSADFVKMREEILRHRRYIEKTYNPPFHVFYRKKDYYLLAVDNCVDILNCAIKKYVHEEHFSRDAIREYLRK